MSKEVIYVGNAVKKDTVAGELIVVELDLKQLKDFLNNPENEKYIRSFQDREGVTHKKLKLEVWPMREESQNKWSTHSVKVDTFIPESRTTEESKEEEKEEKAVPVRKNKSKNIEY